MGEEAYVQQCTVGLVVVAAETRLPNRGSRSLGREWRKGPFLASPCTSSFSRPSATSWAGRDGIAGRAGLSRAVEELRAGGRESAGRESMGREEVLRCGGRRAAMVVGEKGDEAVLAAFLDRSNTSFG